MYKVLSFLSCPSSGGTGPLKRVLWSVNCSRLDNRPSSGGIEPVSWLLPRFRRVRRVSWPRYGRILPVRLLLDRCNSVTRPSPSVVTPLHIPSELRVNPTVARLPVLASSGRVEAYEHVAVRSALSPVEEWARGFELVQAARRTRRPQKPLRQQRPTPRSASATFWNTTPFSPPRRLSEDHCLHDSRLLLPPRSRLQSGRFDAIGSAPSCNPPIDKRTDCLYLSCRYRILPSRPA